MDKDTINLDEENKVVDSILKIKQSRMNLEGKKEYLVLWANYTESWVLESDISSFTIENYNTITKTNIKVSKEAQRAKQPIQSKKAFIYSRTSPKGKTSIQHKLHNLQLDNSSSFSSSGGSGSSAGGGSVTNTVCDSIATQQYYCLKYCIENNIEIEYIAYDENVSGRNMGNLKKELGFFKEHLIPNFSCIVIYDPDRLSRHSGKGLAFLDEMSSKNIDVHFVKQGYVYNKETPSHIKHQICTLLNNAEFYSNQTSERIKNTIKRKKSEGHKFGRPKFGYKFKKVNGINKIIPHRNQQKTITLIKKLYKDFNRRNDKNMSQVARLIISELTSHKITNVRHRAFSKNMIIGILKEDTTLMDAKNSDMYVNILGNNLKKMSFKSGNKKGKLPAPPKFNI